jgi:hypothetical protein
MTIKPMRPGQVGIAQYRTNISKTDAEIDGALSLLVDDALAVADVLAKVVFRGSALPAEDCL